MVTLSQTLVFYAVQSLWYGVPDILEDIYSKLYLQLPLWTETIHTEVSWNPTLFSTIKKKSFYNRVRFPLNLEQVGRGVLFSVHQCIAIHPLWLVAYQNHLQWQSFDCLEMAPLCFMSKISGLKKKSETRVSILSSNPLNQLNPLPLNYYVYTYTFSIYICIYIYIHNKIQVCLYSIPLISILSIPIFLSKLFQTSTYQ